MTDLKRKDNILPNIARMIKEVEGQIISDREIDWKKISEKLSDSQLTAEDWERKFKLLLVYEPYRRCLQRKYGPVISSYIKLLCDRANELNDICIKPLRPKLTTIISGNVENKKRNLEMSEEESDSKKRKVTSVWEIVHKRKEKIKDLTRVELKNMLLQH